MSRLKRNNSLNRKLDACLILLLEIVTSDSFRYTLNNKSALWIRAMTAAEATASRVALSAAKRLPKCGMEGLSGNFRFHGKDPNGTGKKKALS